MFQDRAKHMEIDRHFVKEKLEAGIISLQYITTRHQIVDIMTKAMPRGASKQL